MGDEEMIQEEGLSGGDGDLGGGGGGGGGLIKKLLLFGGPAIVAALVTAAIFIFVVKPSKAPPAPGEEVAPAAEKAAEKKEAVKAEAPPGPAGGEAKEGGAKAPEGAATLEASAEDKFLFPIEPMIVNIFDRTSIRYLRIGLSLGYDDETIKEKLEKQQARIKDAVIFILGDASLRELNDSGGKEMLKEDLIAAINKVLGKNVINHIYFTEFTLQ